MKKKTHLFRIVGHSMEHWLACRGYRVVAPEEITIPEFNVQQKLSTLPLMSTSVDEKLPYLLDKLFFDTVSLRVLVDTNGRQFFLFVRNVSDKKFGKSDMESLCSTFLPFADCIVFAYGIQPQVVTACHRFAAECRHTLEVLQPLDVTYNKLVNKLIPQYTILNEAEILELEARFKTTRTRFAKLLPTDAMKYCGFRSGMVLRKPCGNYRYVP